MSIDIRYFFLYQTQVTTQRLQRLTPCDSTSLPDALHAIDFFEPPPKRRHMTTTQDRIAHSFAAQGLMCCVSALLKTSLSTSIALLRRLGFSEEDVLRQYGFWKNEFHDVRLFSFLREE